MIRSAGDDVLEALLAFRHAPGHAAAAFLSLALAVGAGVPLLAIVRGGIRRGFPAPEVVGGPGAWRGDWSPHALSVSVLQDRSFRAVLWILFALTLLLLLSASVNLLAVIFGRAATRHEELALRVALGADRRRLAGQLAIDTAVLVLPGLLLGTALGFAASRLLRSSWPSGPPPWEARGDAFWPAAAVLIALLLVSGGAGLASLRAVPIQEIAPVLGVQGVKMREARWHRVLVGGQFAASVVVLAGAGLLLRSTVAPGEPKLAWRFDPRDTLTVRVELAAKRTESERREAYRSMLREIRSLPEVVAAGVGSPGAAVGVGPIDRVHALIGAAEDPGVMRAARYHAVSEGFLQALGHASLAKDVFNESDTDASYTAVVNRTFGYGLFHTRDPVGKAAQLGGVSVTKPWYTVAGVVDDLRVPAIGSGAAPVPAIYLSVFQHPPVSAELAIRTRGDPLRLLPRISESMRRVEPSMRIVDAMTYEQRLARFRAPLDWFGALFAVVSGLALCLALSGLYTSTAQSVARREREIGTRRAVGATSGSIVIMVLGEAGGLGAAGAAPRTPRRPLPGSGPPSAFLRSPALGTDDVCGSLGAVIHGDARRSVSTRATRGADSSCDCAAGGVIAR
ncbi:hypothetical protein BH20GEM2_BH20GEM2_01570 [soil metagenome]